ncbi:hypothetical protein Nepgr_012380 [Nepenthes gracilis]|uniref:GATA transcription factor n=1 Tax=Nepenthes gracilis TaxID=150966 RepID=A0AAD3SH35_NEPGR|nr:hypothetical protein Nepgr_012380 [Nepenthes gracilis]
MDEIDIGCFFDNIDDLLEFPCEDFETIVDENDGKGREDCKALNPSNDIWCNKFASDSIFSPSKSNTISNLSAELSIPYEDIIQLEWLSNFVEDSFIGGGMTVQKANTSSNKHFSQNQFQTLSPVSVLESSSLCSNGKAMSLSHEKRARSKRPRPATFNPPPAIQLLSPMSSITDNSLPLVAPNLSFEPENLVESRLCKETIKSFHLVNKKKSKTDILHPPSSREMDYIQNQGPTPPTQAVRKCLHCEITETPQWRAGPMGPKTLCNACGVRYKSGRLFPEYRPAASPTFVPSLHSNSHKKVLEMRNNNLTRKS